MKQESDPVDDQELLGDVGELLPPSDADLPLPCLAEEDQQDILHRRWLSDDVMDLAQAIVRQERAHTRGLYACAGAFTLDPLDPTDDELFL